jgi:hypothetical protein
MTPNPSLNWPRTAGQCGPVSKCIERLLRLIIAYAIGRFGECWLAETGRHASVAVGTRAANKSWRRTVDERRESVGYGPFGNGCRRCRV